jgi:phage tail tape-measure protein
MVTFYLLLLAGFLAELIATANFLSAIRRSPEAGGGGHPEVTLGAILGLFFLTVVLLTTGLEWPLYLRSPMVTSFLDTSALGVAGAATLLAVLNLIRVLGASRTKREDRTRPPQPAPPGQRPSRIPARRGGQR